DRPRAGGGGPQRAILELRPARPAATAGEDQDDRRRLHGCRRAARAAARPRQAVAEMALAIRDEVARRSDPSGQPLQVRIGIDTGPVVAGVLGTSRFSYDLWGGDTVNTAS